MYKSLIDSQRRIVELFEEDARQRGIRLEKVTVRMSYCDDLPRFIEKLRKFENKPANTDIVVGGIKYAA